MYGLYDGVKMKRNRRDQLEGEPAPLFLGRRSVLNLILNNDFDE
jgi:hypothetical protein